MVDRLDATPCTHAPPLLPKHPATSQAFTLPSYSSATQNCCSRYQGYLRLPCSRLPWTPDAPGVAVWDTLQLLLGRHDSDNFLFVYLVLVNQYVATVPAVRLASPCSHVRTLSRIHAYNKREGMPARAAHVPTTCVDGTIAQQQAVAPPPAFPVRTSWTCAAPASALCIRTHACVWPGLLAV